MQEAMLLRISFHLTATRFNMSTLDTLPPEIETMIVSQVLAGPSHVFTALALAATSKHWYDVVESTFSGASSLKHLFPSSDALPRDFNTLSRSQIDALKKDVSSRRGTLVLRLPASDLDFVAKLCSEGERQNATLLDRLQHLELIVEGASPVPELSRVTAIAPNARTLTLRTTRDSRIVTNSINRLLQAPPGKKLKVVTWEASGYGVWRSYYQLQNRAKAKDDSAVRMAENHQAHWRQEILFTSRLAPHQSLWRSLTRYRARPRWHQYIIFFGPLAYNSSFVECHFGKMANRSSLGRARICVCRPNANIDRRAYGNRADLCFCLPDIR